MEKVVCPECGDRFNTTDGLNQHKNDKHKKQEKTTIKPKRITTGKILTYVIPVLIIGLIGYGLFWVFTRPSTSIGAAGSTHIHPVWEVYINGNPIDFSISKYQKPRTNPYVHLEGGDGYTIHIHATGVTMKFFLNSLGIGFDKNCLTMDTGERYCNEGNKTLKFYVNGKLNEDWENYLPKDSDKILISYGNESQNVIQQQLSSVAGR